MKKTLVLAASAIAAAGFGAADASAVDVELYGQVNKSVMAYDDGRDTETNIVDNDISSTRFGFKGKKALENGLTASVLFEVEMQSNASNNITQNNTGTTVTPGAGLASTPSSEGGAFAERHARVGLAGDWGAVFIGQTSTASDYSSEQDLTGTKNVSGSMLQKVAGGLFFRNSDGSNASSIGSSVDNLDGNRRKDVIRYDSPTFNGFQVRVSTAQGGDIDGAVFYSGEIAKDYTVKGAIGYVAFNNEQVINTTADIKESQIAGSLSVKHASGVAATVAYGEQSIDKQTAGKDDPSYWYVKLGYDWDMFEISADYGKFSNMDTTAAAGTDREVQYIGAAAQYNMGHGTSVAAFYKQFDLDENGTNTDAINLYGVNLRVKF